MEEAAIRILNSHRIMAISTVRPDGWPQTTVVGYANSGLDIVFMVFRSGQKFANIQADSRVSIAVAAEPADMSDLSAFYAGANACEITDPTERREAWKLLMQRHSNLSGFQMPEAGDAVFMRAACKYVSVLDFSQGMGHREQFAIDDEGVRIAIPCTTEKWSSASGSDAAHSSRIEPKRGYCDNIEGRTAENGNFRQVLYTGKHIQLVLMALQAGEEIGEEVHRDRDQFFRFEQGEGSVQIDGVDNPVTADFAVIVPAGARHNVKNTGSEHLRLYTIYGPPEHIDGLVQKTRADAAAAHEEWDGKTTE